MIHVLFSIMFLCGLILAGNSRPFNIYRLLVWTHTSTCFLFWFLTDTLLAAVSAVCGVLVGNCSKTAVYLQYRSFLLSRFKKEGEYINKKPNGISKYQNKKGDIIMFRQYRKTIIAALLCFTIITAQMFPCIGIIKAEAARTNTFNGANGTSGDLTWNITQEGHLTITGSGNFKETTTLNNSTSYPEWCKYTTYIKTAEVNVNNITSTSFMFYGCLNLKSVDLNGLDTSNVTKMDYMFYNCKSLTSLDVSKFNTSNVTKMDNMFSECQRLTSLDVSKFNTDKVTDMNSMFLRCMKLTSLDVSGFNTSNVTDMNSMFSVCCWLTNLDVSGFDTSNVTDMHNMFSGCDRLTSLDVSKFNTDKVTNMHYMFSGCYSLSSIDISGFDTSNVTDMHNMFAGCLNLKSLNVSKFNTDKVTNMHAMFSGCASLTTLSISNFNTNNVTDMSHMFGGCFELTNLDVSKFNTSNVTNMNIMFSDCISLTSLDISGFDTSNVTNMSDMFTGCSSLTSLDISNFNTNNIIISDSSDYFNIKRLTALNKLCFFANSSHEYELPSYPGYYWTDENGNIFTKTAKNLTKKVTYIRHTGSPVPTVSPSPEPLPTSAPDDDINTGIYFDSSCTSLAAISTRTHFVNGGNVKQPDNSKVNYKTKTYYTNLQASNIVTVNNKGKTKTKKGKLVAGITSTSEKPSLVKGKTSKDVPASKIAKASINKGKIKVTAQKQPGVVYLWVMDTGDAGAYACAKIIIKAAPSKVQIFSKSSSEEGFSADKKNVYKKDSIEIGSSVKLYVYPSYKQNGQFVETKDSSYSASVNTQAANYFTVTQDKVNPYCFIVTAMALKNNKKTTGRITIKCNENGKKAVFTATAINIIQGMSLGSANGIDDVTSGSAITSYEINTSDTDKKTGSFVISTNKSSSNFETTDKVKLYAMGSADGFDKAMMGKGKVKITSKPYGNQKKLTAKLGNDKKTVTITAAKKVPAGTSVYYLIFYNNKEGKGYKVIEITAK